VRDALSRVGTNMNPFDGERKKKKEKKEEEGGGERSLRRRLDLQKAPEGAPLLVM